MTILEATSRFATLCGSLFHFSSRCSYLPLPAIYVVFLCTGLCSAPAALAETIQLSSSTDTATAGFYQLEWRAPGTPGDLQLYESSSEDFTTATLVYRGADRATVISGKSDGRYFYRVSNTDASRHSNTVVITVRHHPLSLAFSFFTVGGIVFISIFLVIVFGNRNATRQS